MECKSSIASLSQRRKMAGRFKSVLKFKRRTLPTASMTASSEFAGPHDKWTIGPPARFCQGAVNLGSLRPQVASFGLARKCRRSKDWPSGVTEAMVPPLDQAKRLIKQLDQGPKQGKNMKGVHYWQQPRLRSSSSRRLRRLLGGREGRERGTLSPNRSSTPSKSTCMGFWCIPDIAPSKMSGIVIRAIVLNKKDIFWKK